MAITYEIFMEKFPINLNKQQKEAVQAVDGPVLLLAVPGSGKTTVLVARLGYMIYCHGIHPSQILTLTYTVAATNDMRRRFSRFFGDELGNQMEFRTINSVCAGIIKHYGNQIGKQPFTLESDDKVLIMILSSLYQKYEEEYPTESDLKGIKTYITYIKNMMLSDDEILELEKEAGCHLLTIYKEYCKELKMRGCMDYDDQMVYAYRLLKASPELLGYYQESFPYICVDEAQDTSKIQHEIIALLSAKHENLFMVGDEDQSIYGFRAAYPEALLSFEKNHQGAKILLMEENFRSNANIVEAADQFIQKNTLRHEKHMKATKDKGTEIKEVVLKSRSAQYSYLLKVAQDCIEQTAVLYRDNESAIPLVDVLERNQIPYHIRNAELSFFTHRVVVDIQNIMKFAYDMKNADLFELIYYKISTYLTKKMALEACEISREYHISVFSAIFGYLELKPHTRKNLKALETHFNNMRNENPQKALNRILRYMGYEEYMERAGLSDKKVFIMKMIAGKEDTISSFLSRMDELKSIIQNKTNHEETNFILSTIHGSKGLEYNNVYLMDVYDGIFPEEVPKNYKHADKQEIETYEEERRLFYVGVTRAKNNLYLFQTKEISTFIKQLFPKKSVEENKISVKQKNSSVTSKTAYLKEKSVVFSEQEYQEFLFHLAEGVVVVHKTYGQGVVTAIDDSNATILFDEMEKSFNLKILFQKKLLMLEG
ncbi:MAG: ATP-dependent helicase [Lachnospiraceae bacterium]|nr:ATP-dependent helicase [Lachnospiraceae bacterium]